MDESLFHLFLKARMAFLAQFTICTLLQLEFRGIVLAMGKGNSENENHDTEQYFKSRMVIHCKAPHMAIVLYGSHRKCVRQREDASHL